MAIDFVLLPQAGVAKSIWRRSLGLTIYFGESVRDEVGDLGRAYLESRLDRCQVPRKLWLPFALHAIMQFLFGVVI